MKMTNETGTSLLEAIFALSFFGIITVGILPGFLMHSQEVTRTEHRSNAIGLAQEILDDIRSENPAILPSTGTVGPTTYSRGQFTYNTEISYCEDSVLCPTTNTRQITIKVYHQGRIYYEVETVYTALL